MSNSEKRRFSMTRLAHTLVPNFFANDLPPSLASSLTPHRQDMLYTHQLSSPSPYALDPLAFHVAGVTDNEGMSRKVHKALLKHSILRSGSGEVDTMQIGRQFVHQLAVINVQRQRELVNMLFWWEEEVMRLKKLEGEEGELGMLIKGCKAELKECGEDEGLEVRARLDRLKFARERVRMKRRQRPSQRREDIENDTDDLLAVSHCVSAGGRRHTVQEIGRSDGSLAMARQEELERPPEYRI